MRGSLVIGFNCLRSVHGSLLLDARMLPSALHRNFAHQGADFGGHVLDSPDPVGGS
jgi:hypothetical protein